ncbi:MAG: hypothetical protein ACO3EZ_02400 [Prochlorotrichaceae cyanobacterium]
MSETRSSFFKMLQRPQFWGPCSAALLTLLFLGKWVLDPETELPEVPGQEGIVSDRAQQELTTEQSALGSDIDNLDVLLNELDRNISNRIRISEFQSTTLEQNRDQNIDPIAPLPNLPSSSLNPPESGGSSNLNGTPDPLTSSAQLRNFFSPTGAESAPSLIQVTGGEDGTLNLSLTGAPAQPLFGAPQPLGLPQSISVTSLPTTPTGNLPSNSPSTVAPYPYNTSSGVPAAVVQPPASNFAPVNPYNFAPYGAGTVNTPGNGLPSTVGNPSGIVPSPYGLDSSFQDPLAPPLVVSPPYSPSLAPGQYIGNGEINTFANP